MVGGTATYIGPIAGEDCFRTSTSTGAAPPLGYPIPPSSNPPWGSRRIDYPRSPGQHVRHSRRSWLSQSSSLSSSSSTSQLVAPAICKSLDGNLGLQYLQSPSRMAKSLQTTRRRKATTPVQMTSRRALIGGTWRPQNRRLRAQAYH